MMHMRTIYIVCLVFMWEAWKLQKETMISEAKKVALAQVLKAKRPRTSWCEVATDRLPLLEDTRVDASELCMWPLYRPRFLRPRRSGGAASDLF